MTCEQMTMKERWREGWLRTKALFAFGWASRRVHVLIVVVAVTVAVVLALGFSDKSLSDPTTQREAWWLLFDRVATITTLAVAIAVWFGEIREDWERQLPRRLFAYFLYQDQPMAICLGANLGNEQDARALGQQIGAQMFQTKFILYNAARVEQSELPLVITKTLSFKPIRIVFLLTDETGAQVKVVQSAEQPGTVMVWTSKSQSAKDRLLPTDPLCDFRSDRLSQAVIDSVI